MMTCVSTYAISRGLVVSSGYMIKRVMFLSFIDVVVAASMIITKASAVASCVLTLTRDVGSRIDIYGLIKNFFGTRSIRVRVCARGAIRSNRVITSVQTPHLVLLIK